MLFFKDVVQERGLASTCLFCWNQPKKSQELARRKGKTTSFTWHNITLTGWIMNFMIFHQPRNCPDMFSPWIFLSTKLLQTKYAFWVYHFCYPSDFHQWKVEMLKLFSDIFCRAGKTCGENPPHPPTPPNKQKKIYHPRTCTWKLIFRSDQGSGSHKQVSNYQRCIWDHQLHRTETRWLATPKRWIFRKGPW